MKRFAPALLLLAAAACDTLPRDTEGTLDHVRAAGAIRVGVIADARADPAAIAGLLRHVAHATGARAEPVSGAAEPLLAALDAGRLDLVVGTWIEKSPWATDVTLTPPIARYALGGTPLEVRAGVRNGENQWAMLVEHAARDAARERGVE